MDSIARVSLIVFDGLNDALASRHQCFHQPLI